MNVDYLHSWQQTTHFAVVQIQTLFLGEWVAKCGLHCVMLEPHLGLI